MKLYNLARMSTATTGTGTITLGSAVSGFLSFASAGVASGDIVRYAIRDGSNSEIGYGTYTTAGTTLTRNVLKSTNSNTAINLSGSAEVVITPSAEDFMQPSGPTGRLTLVSGQPVLTSNQTAKTTIYYSSVAGGGAGLSVNATRGPFVPSYDGGDTHMVDCGGEPSFILDTGNHLSAKNYDVFWDDAGARLVTGTAWTNNTTRADALAYKNGWLTNNASMTGRISNNGGTTTVAQNRGLYLGTIRCTANGQTGMNFQPAAASGGPTGGAVLGVYNAYNKVACSAYERDTVGNASYAMTSTTWQVFGAAGGNTNNAISWIDGLGDVPVAARFTSDVAGGATSGAAVIGIDFNDSTSAAPDFIAVLYNSTGTSNIAEGTATSAGEYLPVLGYNTIYPKTASYNTNSVAFYGGTGFGGPVADAMQFKATMWM